jgi:hypothetical protein
MKLKGKITHKQIGDRVYLEYISRDYVILEDLIEDLKLLGFNPAETIVDAICIKDNIGEICLVHTDHGMRITSINGRDIMTITREELETLAKRSHFLQKVELVN